MAKREYGRLHFRLSKSEFDLVDQVIQKMGYEGKTAWLRSHLRADAIACGLVELTETENFLVSASEGMG